MAGKRKLIFGTYAVTGFAVLTYFVIAAFRVEESSSIGLLFFPILAAGVFLLLAWVETVVFLLLFRKQFRELRDPLLTMLAVSSLAIVGTCLYLYWTRELPVIVPAPGQLPVPASQFTADKRMVEGEISGKHLDRIKRHGFLDTVLLVETDTIFYSPGLDQFFAWVAIEGRLDQEHRVTNAYVIGRAEQGGWRLDQPEGNIGHTSFDSRASMHRTLLAYYYQRYSINGSDLEKPDIWLDEHIFPTRGVPAH